MPTTESTPLLLAGRLPPTAIPLPTVIRVLPAPITEAMQARLLSDINAEGRLHCLHAVRENDQPVTYMELRETKLHYNAPQVRAKNLSRPSPGTSVS